MEYNNPNSPFLGWLEDGLRTKHRVIVKGTPEKDFFFNLHAFPGSKETSDLDSALQMFVDFDKEKVTMNSRKNSTMGEEVHWNYFPFQLQRPFTLRINVNDESFDILVNDNQEANFRYRLPVETVFNVGVSGGVRLDQAKVC